MFFVWFWETTVLISLKSINLLVTETHFSPPCSGVRLSPLGTSTTNWPIVPAPDGGWWWMWSSRWNKNWLGKPKYSEKTCSSSTLSTTNPTWLDLGSNPGCRGVKPAINCLRYGTALLWELGLNVKYNLDELRLSQRPCGLRHEPSSHATTLGLRVRIPLETWMSVSIYSVFVLLCV
jgi:hypothetical protein